MVMEADRSKALFSADAALTNIAEDQLSRERFCQEFAQAIANWVGKESLVVGLCGEWGSGKTTIKNFIIQDLRQRSPQPTTGEFNPWQWSGQDKLLEGLLSELARLLGKPQIANQNKKVIEKFRLLAAALTFGSGLVGVARSILGAAGILTILYAGIAAWSFGLSPKHAALVPLAMAVAIATGSQIPGVAEKLLKVLEAKRAVDHKSLEQLREDVAREMRNLSQPVILFVDDVDRLTDEEIMLLVQLIKANLRFPNLIYCLLFQKDIVTKALGKLTSEQGDKYLRKIIQVPFDVPMASDARLQKMIRGGLAEIFDRNHVAMTESDNERWNSLFPEIIWPFFENVRDVKRFLGIFEFYFGMHLHEGTLEVNPVDLIAVEALRMFDHTAFLSVGASFHRKGFSIIDLFDDDKIGNDFKDQIQAIVESEKRSPRRGKALEQTLYFLFPQAGKQTRSDSEHAWLAELRICHPKHFRKYFQVSLDEGQPSARDLAILISNSGDREKLKELLVTFDKEGMLEDFLDFILVSKDRIPTSSLETFVTALFDAGDIFAPRSGAFASDPSSQCIRLIFQRLKDEPVPLRTDILWQALQHTSGISLPVRFVTSEDLETRKRGSKADFLIEEEEAPKFCATALQKIRDRANSKSLLSSNSLVGILYRWSDWGSPTEVQQWTRKIMQVPTAARELLRKLTVKMYSDKSVEPFLQGEIMERLVDLEELLRSVESDGSELTIEDQQSAALLKKAVELKREGKPYAEVRLFNIFSGKRT
jgi:predicted KAP-like P-loop ATPase